ncbi:hypothetical protein D3C76_1459900 [compost metagenome]
MAWAVRLVQISKPLSTIKVRIRPKKNQISLIGRPPKSPVCSGRMDSVTNSSAERSLIRNWLSTLLVYGFTEALWNINGYQPGPDRVMWL